ncbi:MAG TPA: glycosyltransferase family 2 protein [Pyrinomonadaceae bacterium]|nr:glycosyltransferase family 2 protein [Pyrinomonadaceae bacterium]
MESSRPSSLDRNGSGVDLSLLVCTYNRAGDLRELLETAVAQETNGEFSYEVVVVDNNSTDETRSVVESFIAAGHKNVRYFFEKKQGKANALNTGLRELKGWAYVIADDDFVLPEDWVKNLYRGFRDNPEVSFVSGKVLPLFQGEPPSWLTAKHWSAIAMADYGDEQFVTDKENQICLLACAFRLADVESVGGYDKQLGPSKTHSGGTEDLDLLKRLWKSGRKGLYLPNAAFYHKATKDRLTKDYHRRWHADHGRSYAIMRIEETEQAKFRLFDVPAYMFREAARDTLRWVGCMIRGRTDDAFWHETQLRFFAGFVAKRRADSRGNRNAMQSQ